MGYILTTLFAVLVVMKALALIDWSWWLVFAPLYPVFFIWFVFVVSFILAMKNS